MKFLIVLLSLIVAALAAPQFYPGMGMGGGMGASSAQAGASSQSFG
jgi:hypothetical protein